MDRRCWRRTRPVAAGPFALGPGETLASRLVHEVHGPCFRINNTEPERQVRHLEPLHTLPEFWPCWVYFDLDAAPLY